MNSNSKRPPPRWAQELVARACNDRALPALIWHPGSAAPAFLRNPGGGPVRFAGKRYTDPDFSCGYVTGKELHLFAGLQRKDQRLVLLHELAHWAGGRREAHGATFWDRFWTLSRRYMPRSLPFVIWRTIADERRNSRRARAAAVRAGLL